MTEPAALRPLVEVAEEIRRLDDYESAADLSAAILAVADALERSLRARLRNDPTAPDDHRLRALAPDRLPLEDVVASLRARDLISLETAGTVHQVAAAVDRAGAATARPGDADLMRQAVDRLRNDLRAAESAGSAGSAEPAETGGPPGPGVELAGTGSAPPARRAGGGRWMRGLAAALAVFALLSAAWVFTRSGAQEYDAALMAFRSGRLDSAAAGFERVLENRPGHVTSMLYLARSYRRLDRPADAAEVLSRAVETDPEDGDVRRELGHLFTDLGRLPSAIAQYERALEYEPEEALNWAALVRALRSAGDARAELLLQDAPPKVQATLSGA